MLALRSSDSGFLLLEKLWRDHRLTLVLVTHDSMIARRPQRLGLMENGRLSIKQDTRHDGVAAKAPDKTVETYDTELK